MKLAESLQKTICYTQIFESVVSSGELFRYFIASDKISFKRIIESHTSDNCAHRQIGEWGSKNYQLWGLSDRPIVFHTKFSRKQMSYNKLYQTVHVKSWLYRIPYVRAVFFTGSMAAINAKKNDDIDLLIITKAGSLWQTRLWVTLLLEKQHLRRKPESALGAKPVTNKFCPNMFLDETTLTVPESKRNLYTAHEVLQAKVWFDKDNIYEDFIQANKWVREFLPHSPITKKKVTKQPSPISFIGQLWEKINYLLQKWYMSSKVTTEIVDDHRALFHPRDTQKWVLDNYQKLLHEYSL